MHDINRYKTAIHLTLLSSVVNLFLALLKIIIGSLGYSHALIADGIHSLSDLITDGLVLLAAKMGNQLPDQAHPYGHRRIETIGVIIVSLVLIIAAIGIAYDSLNHLLVKQSTPLPGISTVIIAVISIVLNEIIYRYTVYYGNKTHSDLLKSNAWHHRVDAIGSIIVLISIVGSRMGLTYLDPIGALILGAWIFKIGILMIWKAIQELIDTGIDEKTTTEITQFVLSVPGVVSIHQLRTRLHGENILVDLHIQVMPNISVSEGHYISEQVNFGLIKKFHQVADVTVHIDPENDALSQPSQNLPNRKVLDEQLKQSWHNLPGYEQIQRTTLHYLNGKLHIELLMALDVLKSHTAAELEKLYRDAINSVSNIGSITIHFQ